MSTCRGCWTDERTPNEQGMVLLLPHSAITMVAHIASIRCPTAEPHRIGECSEFAEPRRGFEPDPEPLGPWPRPRFKYDWTGWGE